MLLEEHVPTTPPATNTPVPPASSPTGTPTSTATSTPTHTVSATATHTVLNTPTQTATSTPSSTASLSPTTTVSNTVTGTGTQTATSTVSFGAIALIGWVRNGNAEVGFVNTGSSNIGAGTVLYFTNLAWDSAANGGAGGFSDQSSTTTVAIGSTPTPVPQTEVENIVSYTVGNGGLAPYTPVYFGNPGNMTDALQGGILANVYAGNGSGTALTGTPGAAVTYLPASGNGVGGKVIVYEVPSSGATVFLTGLLFGPDSWTAGPISTIYDSSLPPGLGAANSLDLSTLWNDNLAINQANAGGDNQSAILTQCVSSLSGILTGSNWGEVINGKGSLGMPSSGMSACTGAGSVGFTFTVAQTPTVLPY